jgi:hypothetical protein
MALNLPMSPIVVPADPNVEGVGSGMEGGTCGAAIGITTGIANVKATDWSREARLLIKAQPVGWGGDSIVTGQLTADIPNLKTVNYAAADFNNDVSFVQAIGAVAPDAEIADGAINRTGTTLQAGDWAFGDVAVA